MKAVIYHSYDDIRVEQRPIPSITDQELLVKVHGCGLCGSDIIKIVQQANPPVILGHELTGSVVRRGQAVADFNEGQRVIVAHHAPCGQCHYCRHRNYSMCAAFKASNIDPCGFAEYIRVPAENVQQTTFLLPDTLSDEEASFTEPLGCCVRAVRRTPLQDGDSIVIIGLGSIGLLMLQATRALGAAAGHHVRVYGVDLVPERLQLARELGADEVFAAPSSEQGLRDLLNEVTAGRGADCVILTVAGARPFLQALASLRKGGTLNIFAAHSGAVPLDIEKIYQQELSVISTYSSSPEDLRIALDLLTHREVRADKLISHHLPLERFHEGVELMRGRAALKVYFQIAGEIHGK
ncbi:alcohol dehydrogenase [Ktedonosporobacter rubrisoli]|uniref:Alcohol dehydrogenase n=1 Tax=Ktedonosporobacter rubrisoli TaxID=2509675 RepID=A0A4V0YZB3_KTERU|nr:alcohol dehydrogenase catalytic domain-containing protein [Ktedonosporobacter rubrisoli]QBD79121.1 alcohol dehydrogenase [Ktedonosporobacter rubrisoli]